MNRRTERGCDAHGRERGSAAVELVLATPLLILVLLVVVALGRLVDARLVVADAAHQAARAASLARTEKAAHAEAERAASRALREAGSACTHPRVHLTTGQLRPGAMVLAEVSCTASLGDLTRSSMPGRIPVTRKGYSVVDRFRSTP